MDGPAVKVIECSTMPLIPLQQHVSLTMHVSLYIYCEIITLHYSILDWLVRFMVLNSTFNNISVISYRSVLLVEETGVPGENH